VRDGKVRRGGPARCASGTSAREVAGWVGMSGREGHGLSSGAGTVRFVVWGGPECGVWTVDTARRGLESRLGPNWGGVSARSGVDAGVECRTVWAGADCRARFGTDRRFGRARAVSARLGGRWLGRSARKGPTEVRSVGLAGSGSASRAWRGKPVGGTACPGLGTGCGSVCGDGQVCRFWDGPESPAERLGRGWKVGVDRTGESARPELVGPGSSGRDGTASRNGRGGLAMG
jgi:hypothetical protein